MIESRWMVQIGETTAEFRPGAEGEEPSGHVRYTCNEVG